MATAGWPATRGDLSYARGEARPALLETTIGACLAATVSAHPDRDALIDLPARRRWNYAELWRDVRRLATGLLQAGISAGDRVGIWAPNCAEWVLTQYATAEIGAVLVTINPAYRSHELAYALNQSGLAMVISASRFKTSDYVALLREVAPACPGLREAVFIDSARWRELAGTPVDTVALAHAARPLRATDPINIQYTSGTTGYPKGVTLSHRNILNNGYLVGDLLGYTHRDRICLPVPLYHCFGLVMGNLAATSHGAAIILPGPGFDPAATLRAVQEEACTSLYGVPTMFIAELGLPDFADYDLTSLRTGIMAGSPCPAQVMRRVIDDMHMTEIAICYGMTETSLMIDVHSSYEHVTTGFGPGSIVQGHRRNRYQHRTSARSYRAVVSDARPHRHRLGSGRRGLRVGRSVRHPGVGAVATAAPAPGVGRPGCLPPRPVGAQGDPAEPVVRVRAGPRQDPCLGAGVP